jgi:hypothetical protein
MEIAMLVAIVIGLIALCCGWDSRDDLMEPPYESLTPFRCPVQRPSATPILQPVKYLAVRQSSLWLY